MSTGVGRRGCGSVKHRALTGTECLERNWRVLPAVLVRVLQRNSANGLICVKTFTIRNWLV